MGLLYLYLYEQNGKEDSREKLVYIKQGHGPLDVSTEEIN
jgi:hypothetical protein